MPKNDKKSKEMKQKKKKSDKKTSKKTEENASEAVENLLQLHKLQGVLLVMLKNQIKPSYLKLPKK